MFFCIQKISALTKKFLVLFFLLISLFSIHATDFPETLSESATISLVAVHYDSKFRSPFSKTCLRIFDTEHSFDQVIDFAHFEDFADEFFPIKFFVNKKKAQILVKQFLPFFMEETQDFRASVSEMVVQLNQNEITYIYNFIRTMHTALPYYEYDFDFLTDNAETHISQILHDSKRMFGEVEKNDDKKTSEQSSYFKIANRSLSYKKLNESFVLLADTETQSIQVPISEAFSFEKRQLFIIMLLIFSFLFFLITIYQTIVYFFPQFYRISLFKSIQILDFLLFFFSGIVGFVIFYLHIFSGQSLFKTNFHFLALNPLHILATFYFFTIHKYKRAEVFYWSVMTGLEVLYILILSLVSQEFPMVSLLSVLPIFLRTMYYNFVAIDIRKERTFKPYALFLKFVDFISS